MLFDKSKLDFKITKAKTSSLFRNPSSKFANFKGTKNFILQKLK